MTTSRTQVFEDSTHPFKTDPGFAGLIGKAPPSGSQRYKRCSKAKATIERMIPRFGAAWPDAIGALRRALNEALHRGRAGRNLFSGTYDYTDPHDPALVAYGALQAMRNAITVLCEGELFDPPFDGDPAQPGSEPLRFNGYEIDIDAYLFAVERLQLAREGEEDIRRSLADACVRLVRNYLWAYRDHLSPAFAGHILEAGPCELPTHRKKDVEAA